MKIEMASNIETDHSTRTMRDQATMTPGDTRIPSANQKCDEAESSMSNEKAFKVALWLGLAVIVQALLIPSVPHLAPSLLVGVTACVMAIGFLISRHAPALD